MKNIIIVVFWSIPFFLVAKNYYLDSLSGKDYNAGTFDKPWQTLSPIYYQQFIQGDTIFFKRGSSFTGNVVITSSGTEEYPIVLTAYGEGDAPRFRNPLFERRHFGRVIEIKGNYVVVNKLCFSENLVPPANMSPEERHRSVTEMGAVFLHKGADHNVVEECEFFRSPIGIRVRGEHNLISNNYLHDADSITYNWGSIAIVIVGAYNEASYNKIVNYGYYGGRFGLDGAAFELDAEDKYYNAHTIYIHHNVSINTKGGFCEITGATDNILLSFNVSDDIDKFVGSIGVKNLSIINNTIIRTRNPNFYQMVFWQLDKFAPEHRKSEYRIINNIFYLGEKSYVYYNSLRDNGIGKSFRQNNLYFSPYTDVKLLLGCKLQKTECAYDPHFENLKEQNYGLISESLARNRCVKSIDDRGMTTGCLYVGAIQDEN